LVHVYEETGTFNAAVRVTDIEGGQESAVQEITVHPPGWVQIPLPVSGVAAPSLAVIDGHPAVSLCINDSVLYVRADSVTGDSPEDWPDPVEVDAPTTVSLLNDLAEINGNPAIAYTADSAFRFARSVSSEGMNAADWSQKAEIAQPEDSNGTGFLSLALISGNPAVSYYVAKLSPTRCLIVFNRASTATGSNDADWTDYVTVHEYETWWVPQGPPALCDVLGHPALAYYADSGEGLRLFYVWSTTSTGGSAADWSQKVQFNYTINKIGSLFCRLAKAAFCPAIVYISKNSLGDTEYVNYIRATTSTGQLLGDWAEGAQWEHTSSGYWFCGLAMAAGNPAIVYHDADASALMFTISETSDGGNSDDWSEPEDVAEKPAWGYCDLAAVYGNPAFVYADDNEKQVYYCYLRR